MSAAVQQVSAWLSAVEGLPTVHARLQRVVLLHRPALDVIRLLHQRGAQISYHDPHVPALKEDGVNLTSVPLNADTLRGADCVMIITDHSSVDYQLVKRHARATVDTRHVLPRENREGRGASGGRGSRGGRA